MFMISIHISSPPQKRTELFNTLKLLINPVSVAPGCRQSRLFEDTSKTGSFMIVEEWLTRDDLVRRMKTDEFKKLLTVIEMSSTPPEIRCEKIFNANGIETIDALIGGIKTPVLEKMGLTKE